MNNRIDVYINVFDEGKVPQYGSIHSAGCDIYATEDMVIRPGEIKIMPLNFQIAIPQDIEVQIRPRSGLSLKTNLRIPNSPGTVDSDYRDEVGVIFENSYNISNLAYEISINPEILSDLKDNYKEVTLIDYLRDIGISLKYLSKLGVLNEVMYIDKKGNPYGTIYIKKGERIAQMVFCKYYQGTFIPHENPREIGEDRGGGFGHTGTR